jgi:hypothetical protein
MFFFDPTCSGYLTNVREMSNPRFIIERDDVTTYIISSARRVYDDGPITTDLPSDFLSRHIGYAPPAFIENLVGPGVNNTDLESMVVLYSLLIMDILPPSGLRIPINRILYSHNGEDLMRHLVDTSTSSTKFIFVYIIDNKVLGYQQKMQGFDLARKLSSCVYISSKKTERRLGCSITIQ